MIECKNQVSHFDIVKRVDLGLEFRVLLPVGLKQEFLVFLNFLKQSINGFFSSGIRISLKFFKHCPKLCLNGGICLESLIVSLIEFRQHISSRKKLARTSSNDWDLNALCPRFETVCEYIPLSSVRVVLGINLSPVVSVLTPELKHRSDLVVAHLLPQTSVLDELDVEVAS